MDQAGKKRRSPLRALLSWADRYGALVLALIVVSGVCLLFSYRKSGLFIDEVYTYGLSNSHYAPYLTDAMGGSLRDKVMTRQDLLDYVTVSPGQGFDPGSVVYNQEADVHPPLYYWLFNLVSSFFPGVFSFWPALALDWAIYMCALLCLYLLAKRLFSSGDIAAAAVILYGLSTVGLSTMLMIRMYVLLTALTVLLALLIVKFLDGGGLPLCPAAGVCIFLGLMTQYYFVFYAFFLCLTCLILLLNRREIKRAAVFSACAVAGALCLIPAFPGCIAHLFSGKLVSGGSAAENLTAFSQYVPRLIYYVRELIHRFKAPLYIALLAVAALMLMWKKLSKAFKGGAPELRSLLVIVPAIVTFALVAVISPVTELRYVYNVVPFFVIAVCLLLKLLERAAGDMSVWVKKGAVLLLLALALWEARCLPPDYLYPEHNDYKAALAAHSSAPCVYLTDDSFVTVTEDLPLLLTFDELFLTGDPASPALRDFLSGYSGSTECVVFVDTSVYWSSGFDPDVMLPRLIEATDYTDYELLFDYALSSAYLLTAGD